MDLLNDSTTTRGNFIDSASLFCPFQYVSLFFLLPSFGIVEAGKRAALTLVEKDLPALGCEGPE